MTNGTTDTPSPAPELPRHLRDLDYWKNESPDEECEVWLEWFARQLHPEPIRWSHLRDTWRAAMASERHRRVTRGEGGELAPDFRHEVSRLCDRAGWCLSSRYGGDIYADLDALEEQLAIVQRMLHEPADTPQGDSPPDVHVAVGPDAVDECLRDNPPPGDSDDEAWDAGAAHGRANERGRWDVRLRRWQSVAASLRETIAQLRGRVAELETDRDQWRETAIDLRDTNDERGRMLDMAAERDRALCDELDELRTYLDNVVSVLGETAAVYENIGTPQACEVKSLAAKVKIAIGDYNGA